MKGELAGFFGAGYCNLHRRTGIDKTVGGRFGAGQGVALDREKDTR